MAELVYFCGTQLPRLTPVSALIVRTAAKQPPLLAESEKRDTLIGKIA